MKELEEINKLGGGGGGLYFFGEFPSLWEEFLKPEIVVVGNEITVRNAQFSKYFYLARFFPS